MKTYLYIKTHNITGLKYFGKTTKDPYGYRGSGKYWLRHLVEHGAEVSTVIFGVYSDPDALRSAALAFSIENDIVRSPGWANLIQENGFDGKPAGAPGHVFTPDQKVILSGLRLERWSDPEYRARMVAAQRAAWTPERRRAQSTARTGIARPQHSKAMQERWKDPGFKGFDLRSIARTSEHNQKIAAALRGKPKTDAHRAALSASAIARAKAKKGAAS